MIDVIISIAAFVVAIGIMVTVHEYGHYRVARWCGVRVLRFSVGFGRPLWRRTLGADQTEWRIGSIPLGGYVKMLDEREGEVDRSEVHRAFNRQHVARRSAIVAAGPVVNILLAVVAYTVMFLLGTQGLVPRVGTVEAGSPAAEAGFDRGDLIVAVDGVQVQTWTEVRLTLLDLGLSGDRQWVPVTVRNDDGTRSRLRLNISRVSLEQAGTDLMSRLGLEVWRPRRPARIGGLVDGAPAAQSGLQVGDRVIRLGGTPIDHWRELRAYVRARPGETIPFVVERDGRRLRIEVTTERVRVDGETFGRIGALAPPADSAERNRMLTTVRYGPIQALIHGVAKAWNITTLTITVLIDLVTGEADLSNISGPVSIAHFAGQSLQIGLASFIGFIGLISISIGILNLLPIPVLDGGHLLYYAIEAVKGSPLSERAQAVGQQIGLTLLLALMALALYNDFVRLVS